MQVRPVCGLFGERVIGVLHPIAGKHQRAGGKINGMMAHHHEDLDPIGPVTQ